MDRIVFSNCRNVDTEKMWTVGYLCDRVSWETFLWSTHIAFGSVIGIQWLDISHIYALLTFTINYN